MGEEVREVIGQLRDIHMAFGPCPISRSQGRVVGAAVLPNALRNDPLAWEQRSVVQADEVIAGRSGGAPVALDKRMNPVEARQSA